jgi:hypothetical protein
MKGLQMKRAYFGLIVLMLALNGCKSEVETAMSEMVDKFKEVTQILKGVTDKNSAIAAKAKIEAVGRDMEALAKKYNNKVARTDEMKKAEEKFKPQMEQAVKEMTAEAQRIGNIPGAAEPIQSALMALGTKMQGLAGR